MCVPVRTPQAVSFTLLTVPAKELEIFFGEHPIISNRFYSHNTLSSHFSPVIHIETRHDADVLEHQEVTSNDGHLFDIIFPGHRKTAILHITIMRSSDF